MIDRRSSVSVDEFMSTYAAGSRPLVLTGAMADWPALTRWTPEYLRETCGCAPVEVMAWRTTVAHTEIDNAACKTHMSFSAYIDTVLSVTAGNNFYMVANNPTFRNSGMKALLDDIGQLPYLTGRCDEQTFFWFGPAGTVTPLHYDLMDILLCQVIGRKRVTLVAPTQGAFVYPSVGVFASVDPEYPDLVKHPLYSRVHKDEFILEPGECLFIPRSWWHHVRSLDVSISVSMTNFRSS